MYNNIESTVIIMVIQEVILKFKLERGVRQCCPLSAYLFILAIKILANKIRHGKNINGIKIDKKTIKISLLADNLTLILKDLQSIENALELLNSFSLCFGLQINIEKNKSEKLR